MPRHEEGFVSRLVATITRWWSVPQAQQQPHVMIDIETLGMQPGSAILSIGAVIFDPRIIVGESILQKFYVVVNTDSCTHIGLSVDPSTVAWWEQQSPEAKMVLLLASSSATSRDVRQALQYLANFIPENALVWSNGANFDQPLLDVAYNRCGQKLPWKYFNSRCYRTIKSMCEDEKALRSVNELKHDALSDAVFQAQHLVAMVQSKGFTI